MRVVPLTTKKASDEAFGRLRQQLLDGATAFKRRIGFKGGSVEVQLYWRAADRFWVHLDPGRLDNRFWCCYGVQDPHSIDGLHITVQINPPLRGFDRKIAGVFVEGPGKRVYLAHTGKVGGGRKGIGKDTFLDFLPGPTFAAASWPDGEESEVILVAALGDSRLPQQVASFVLEVARFKNTIGEEETPEDPEDTDSFSPEFEGNKSYVLGCHVESSCDHGPLVRALKESLDGLGLAACNDRQRDLFTRRTDGLMDLLFEMKTGFSSTDLYTGVGQLMIHGARQDSPPRRILVLPRGLSKEHKTRLLSLGVSVLEYSWGSAGPKFKKLAEMLGAM